MQDIYSDKYAEGTPTCILAPKSVSTSNQDVSTNFTKQHMSGAEVGHIGGVTQSKNYQNKGASDDESKPCTWQGTTNSLFESYYTPGRFRT